MEDITIRCASLSDVELIQKLNYKLFKLEKENFDSTLILDWPLSEEGKKYYTEVVAEKITFLSSKKQEEAEC